MQNTFTLKTEIIMSISPVENLAEDLNEHPREEKKKLSSGVCKAVHLHG